MIDKLQQRIQTLEHALDQALLVIDDLRCQRQDQQFLENQLAETEEFAHIQYKAVQELKRQLNEARTELAEAQSLSTTQSMSLETLETEVQTAQATYDQLQSSVSYHTRIQATLQQQCRELEIECDRQQNRIQELEHQLVELQEQVLHQAQQAREYEAAVRHWKHRCHTIRELVLALQTDALQGHNITAEDLGSVLIHLPENIDLDDDDILKTAAPLHVQPELSKVDLPEFLAPATNQYIAK
jgi:chromosome segregation ATPase